MTLLYIWNYFHLKLFFSGISPTRFKNIWVKAANEIMDKLAVEFTPVDGNFVGRQAFLANSEGGGSGR
jgi:hypothetical protein